MKKFLLKYKRFIIFFAVIAVGIVIDVITKSLAVEHLIGNGRKHIIPYLIDFIYVENDGAAFGMLDGHRWVFLVISSIAIISLLVYSVLNMNNLAGLYFFGIPLVISGGIGNMIDRLSLGYVVDFIDFAFMEFAVFNIADTLVCIGAPLICLGLIIDIVKESRSKKSTEDTKDEDNG